MRARHTEMVLVYPAVSTRYWTMNQESMRRVAAQLPSMLAPTMPDE
jgi:hypothetical protein